MPKAQQLEQATKALHKYFDKMGSFKVKGVSSSTYIHYNIATPAKASAKKIDKTVPTVVFCNPVLLSTYFWDAVHANPSLRRFNLVTYDLRGHGKTNGKLVGTYDRKTAAADLAKLLAELSIPKAFVCGVSLGSLIALQFAIDYPAQCLGLMLVSVIPTPDLPDVVEGRKEITENFLEACPTPKNKDVDQLHYAVRGYMQLGFNERIHPRLDRLLLLGVPWVINNFCIDHAGFRAVTVNLMADTVPLTRAEYARIPCRVSIVHYLGDVAYPVDVAQDLEANLHDAGIKAELTTIKGGCHFGTFTDEIRFNELLENALRQTVNFDHHPAPNSCASPWLELWKDVPDFATAHEQLGTGTDSEDDEDDGVEIHFS